MDHRELLSSLLAGAVTLTAEPRLSRGLSRTRLRILMLGGTNYVGPHLVQAALDRGHEVTLGPFEDLPRWIPDSDPEPGFYRISNARARARIDQPAAGGDDLGQNRQPRRARDLGDSGETG